MAEDQSTDPGERSSTEPDDEELTPKAKATAIFIANAVIFGFAFVAQFIAYKHLDPGKTPDRPSIFIPLLVTGGAGALCLLPMAATGFAKGFVELLEKLPFRQAKSKDSEFFERILDQNDFGWSKAFRVLITVATYLSATLLVLFTGGMTSSPYSPFPVAVVFLGPVIMTSPRTKRLNLLLGSVFILLLYAIEDFDDWSGPFDWLGGRVQDLPDSLRVRPAVLGLAAAAATATGLYFNIVADRPQQSIHRQANGDDLPFDGNLAAEPPEVQ